MRRASLLPASPVAGKVAWGGWPNRRTTWPGNGYPSAHHHRIIAHEFGAGQWQMPCDRGSGGRSPVNIESGKRNRGVNTLALWVRGAGQRLCLPSLGHLSQMGRAGLPGPQGEHASYVVFYREIESNSDDDDANASGKRLFARATPVFNADQWTGSKRCPSLRPKPSVRSMTLSPGPAPSFDIAARKPFSSPVSMKSTCRRAKLLCPAAARHPPPRPIIRRPLLHELTHWTGVESRCHRDLSGRFGTEAYAMEGLVAELGAAFSAPNSGLPPSRGPTMRISPALAHRAESRQACGFHRRQQGGPGCRILCGAAIMPRKDPPGR